MCRNIAAFVWAGLSIFGWALFAYCAPPSEPDAVTIPIDQIIQGRRGLRGLDPNSFVVRDTSEKWKQFSDSATIQKLKEVADKSKALQVERSMGRMRPIAGGMSAGFAVSGRGPELLDGVHRVLVEGESPVNRMSADVDVSIVFYAAPSLPIQLDSVVRQKDRIAIRYALIPQASAYLPWHLSVIPLGKLPLGKYQVEMIRSTEKERALLPKGLSPAPVGSESPIVSGPFEFEVVEAGGSN